MISIMMMIVSIYEYRQCDIDVLPGNYCPRSAGCAAVSKCGLAVIPEEHLAVSNLSLICVMFTRHVQHSKLLLQFRRLASLQS